MTSLSIHGVTSIKYHSEPRRLPSSGWVSTIEIRTDRGQPVEITLFSESPQALELPILQSDLDALVPDVLVAQASA